MDQYLTTMKPLSALSTNPNAITTGHVNITNRPLVASTKPAEVEIFDPKPKPNDCCVTEKSEISNVEDFPENKPSNVNVEIKNVFTIGVVPSATNISVLKV